MKAIEFMYWLQGSMELESERNYFNTEQTATIKRHLEMVKITDKPMTPFCHWLEGYFDMVKPTEISCNQFDVLKTKLNSCFNHVVQPQATGVHIKPSGGLHNPLDPNNNDILYRC